MAGWENAKDLPQGLGYETPGLGIDGTHISFFKYAGASAAQSPILHCLDTALGVQHYPTLTRGSSKGENLENRTTYIYEMRKYMLREHREFITALEGAPSIRAYCESLRGQTTCTHILSAYDRCVENLKNFRDFHIQLVTRYIVIPSVKLASGRSPVRDAVIESSDAKGTGGTGK
jgi:indoleamine 2,3-dioxygenase